MASEIDRDTATIARVIAELGENERSRVFAMSWWSERVMDWAMARPAFKTQLFRFVDVFPALRDGADIATHLREYFGELSLFDPGPRSRDDPSGRAPSGCPGRNRYRRVPRELTTRN